MTGRPKKHYVFVTCHRCGNRWKCTSEMEFVSCPSCTYKTRRIKPKQAPKQNPKGDDPSPHTGEPKRPDKPVAMRSKLP